MKRRLSSPANTHTCLTTLFPRLSRSAGTRKVKPIWILLKQEIVSGSGISWAICKSAPHSTRITTAAPHHSVFLQAGCPSCRPTNSVKALKTILFACEHYSQFTHRFQLVAVNQSTKPIYSSATNKYTESGTRFLVRTTSNLM